MKNTKKFDDQKKIDDQEKIDNKKEVVMDIIYKHETNVDNESNFSIDLSSHNEFQNMIFKGRDE